MIDLTRTQTLMCLLRSALSAPVDPVQEQRRLKEAAIRRLAETSPHLLDDIGVRAPKDW